MPCEVAFSHYANEIMKKTFVPSLAMLALIAAETLRAQSLYFDPSMTGPTAGPSGGSGSFNSDDFSTANGPGGTDQLFITGAQPNFTGAAGTVTVDAPVTISGPISINTSSGATETIGAAGTTNAITVNVASSQAIVNIDGNTSSDTVIQAPIIENLTASPIYNTFFINSSAHNATYGSIAVSGMINNATDFIDLIQAGSGTTTVTGAVTNLTGNNINSTPDPYLRVGDNGSSPTATYILSSTSSLSNVGLGVSSGTLLVQSSNIHPDSIGLGTNATILTDGAGVDITGSIYTNGAPTTDTIGGRGAFDSTVSATIGDYHTASTLTAGAGGEVHFTGDIYAGNGINVTGPGIVSLEHGNDYNGLTTVTSGAILLLNNPVNNGSGSATGYAGYGGSVQVNAGGLLGGTGRTFQNVTVEDPSSIIAPGGMTASGSASVAATSTVGTLTLSGGLSAENGVTMNFTLDGTNPNSVINLAGSILQLNGTMTFNFTNIGGPLALNTNYTIVTGIGAQSDIFSDPNDVFIINAPAGYTADASVYPFYTGSSDDNGTIFVQFQAAPEPATYAMMIAGIAMLGFCVSRRRA